MLTTLVFYVTICSSESNCNSYEPASWTYTNEVEREEAYQQCELLVNTFDSLKEVSLSGVRETDCFIEE